VACVCAHAAQVLEDDGCDCSDTAACCLRPHCLLPLCLPPYNTVCGPESLAIGLARVGQDSQRIIAGSLAELAAVDFGPPLHSLVLVGSSLHDLERAMFEHFRPAPGQWPAWVRPEEDAGSGSDADSDAGGR
jgi:hypothetical protein